MTINTTLDFGNMTSNSINTQSVNVMPSSTFLKFIQDTAQSSEFLGGRVLGAYYGSAVAQVFFASRNMGQEDASPKYIASNKARQDNALAMIHWLHTVNFKPSGDEFGTIESTIDFCKESYTTNKARVQMINAYLDEYQDIDASFQQNMSQVKAKTLSENLKTLDPKFHALMEAKITEQVDSDKIVQDLAVDETKMLCNLETEVQLQNLDEGYLYSAFSKLVETVDQNGVKKEGKIVKWIADAKTAKMRETRAWHINNWATNIALMKGMLTDAKVILADIDALNIVETEEASEDDMEPSQKTQSAYEQSQQDDKDCQAKDYNEGFNFPVV